MCVIKINPRENLLTTLQAYKKYETAEIL